MRWQAILAIERVGLEPRTLFIEDPSGRILLRQLFTFFGATKGETQPVSWDVLSPKPSGT